MITIIDYGMGNLASVYNSFIKVGIGDIQISSSPDAVWHSEKLVLPGVGAFEDAMKNLDKYNLIQPLLNFIQSGKPFLGICLGMHLLFEKSYENGVFEGLGILKGEVTRFNINLPVPHMGWNQTLFEKKSGVFDILPDNAYFYFDHSYYPVPEDESITAAKTKYGIEFVSAVMKDNIYAVQFHPEKSHKNGLSIIERFGKL